MSLRLSASILAVLAVAGGVSAQAPGGGLSDTHVVVLGGATVDPDRPHLAGGVMGGAGAQGWGVLGLAMLGRGGDYDSTLLGGAASRRLMRGASWSTLVFGGYALYGEKGITDIERDASGILFGASARWRVSGVTLAAVYSHVTGNYDKPDVTAPFRFHVPRVSLGIGF